MLGAGRDDALCLLVVGLEEVVDEVRRQRNQVNQEGYRRDGAEIREPSAALSTFCRLTHC